MKLQFTVTAAAALAAILALSVAQADPVEDDQLVINGEEELATQAPAPDHLQGALGETVYSGWLFRDTETRAMQKDDFDNPMFLFVDAGLEAWDKQEGTAGKSCADCHNDIGESMRGVRAQMPKVNDKGELWSLENYVNDCRTNRMGAEAWGWNSQDMKNMTAAIGVQSRGMPVAVKIDGPAAPFWEKGKEMYYTRYGQLEMSCANCHEDNFGKNIRSDHLSQGQINGFPLYRLKDQGAVSAHQRFVGCIRDTRGVPFEPGGLEFRELELYVASRGNGLAVETPAVRH
ncbi:MAG TPA: sulfur oxidation c-type cytochrome SoxA [Paracoccus sp. (in: a-proteobacteria)]|uniref:sulfur oxidation c-type cytochrome SoxA n=1 Tax=Paracoccus sp. TaxID=267 RepID=UPI002C8E9C16|nr:sulfur oxidation c-type cytochrome SoxA [Paracoccus sp. (in: a-proteobacteria)]HWL55843.1 sulfur oxidation c-type cytochrome SoxA [Paracoccus sp. (in: a-proteobacteria)]